MSNRKTILASCEQELGSIRAETGKFPLEIKVIIALIGKNHSIMFVLNMEEIGKLLT